MEKKWKIAIAVASALILTVGCSAGIGGLKKRTYDDTYSAGQVKMIASSEKNRYEEVYGEGVWAMQTGSGTETFSTVLLNEIHSFMDQIHILGKIAFENGTVLSAGEEDAVALAAEEYYSGLTQDDIAKMDRISLEDVKDLYRDYAVAQKQADTLVSNPDLQVSDSEARVMDVMLAKTGDKAKAQKLRDQAKEDPSSFRARAQESGVDVQTVKVGRGMGIEAAGDASEELENAAFSLSTGSVGDVITVGDNSYVLYCVSDYNADETAQWREELFSRRIQSAFRQLYSTSDEKDILSDSSAAYKRLDIAEIDYGKNADFFEIAEKHLGSFGLTGKE
ncbi:foldase protein PrsA [[Clostridium] aminophilum]|uniref:Foldase protein PrsA n=1 Tax=[Clostridium] aminophilum TaxID=1526 RepID=A0A1I0FYG2_9FIRM|nr:peptidylprolyl isomerase [[Clostridium] aminophilum]SET63437.1 foldase protein PrsA [[Clostridium] aminophilum]